MILTGNDMAKIEWLEWLLAQEFEIKIFSNLKYFLRIEVGRLRKIYLFFYLSQLKYVLDLLKDTCILGCNLGNTTIDVNHKIEASIECTTVHKESY